METVKAFPVKVWEGQGDFSRPLSLSTGGVHAGGGTSKQWRVCGSVGHTSWLARELGLEPRTVP
jgi:hypothetical protein